VIESKTLEEIEKLYLIVQQERQIAIIAERARILAALERLEHHGTWQDGRPIYWRADEVMRVVRGERDGN